MIQLYIDIYRYGAYYNPAQNHYGQPVIVNCDKCLQSDLVACIGWGEHDLCLECAATIDTMVYNGELVIDDFSDSD